MYSRNLSFDIRHIIQNNKKSIEFDTHTHKLKRKKNILNNYIIAIIIMIILYLAYVMELFSVVCLSYR